jgi:hypothetical protein
MILRDKTIAITSDTLARIKDMRALFMLGQNNDQIIAEALKVYAESRGYTFDDYNDCVPLK